MLRPFDYKYPACALIVVACWSFGVQNLDRNQ